MLNISAYVEQDRVEFVYIINNKVYTGGSYGHYKLLFFYLVYVYIFMGFSGGENGNN